VLIADDHALVRAGLRALLEAQPDMEIVGEADSGVVVERLCVQLSPDVVLMDLTMPGRGGIAATRDVRSACPGAKVIALTMHEDETYARQAASAGASGFILKRALAHELVEAIRSVHRGGRPVAPEMASAFSSVMTDRPKSPESSGGIGQLSEREREVVALVALGHTNAEIGARLHISEKTVETHRAHVLRKLGLRTRADIVRFAIEHGLMTD
jgi:two-component system response regulator NreC